MQLFRRSLLYSLQLLVLVSACGGSQYKDHTTSDVPPLPPTANTSVGILLEEREALALLPEQIATLRGIESELEAVNEPLEAHLAELEASTKTRRPAKSSASGKSGATMRGGGGRGGGGMRTGGRRGGGRGRAGTGTRARQAGPSPEVQARVQSAREMTRENNQIALARAMAPLSPTQREAVRSLLDQHGHDVPETALAAAEYRTAVAHGVPMASPRRRGAQCLAKQLTLSREHLKQLMIWLAAKRNREETGTPLDEILTQEQQALLEQTLNSCGFEVVEQR